MDTLLAVGTDHVWVDDSQTPGPVVVMLHEGIADSRMWDPICEAVAARCRIIRYDVRGYGRSPAPTQRYRLLDDLIIVLDHFEVNQATLVGCSMGGGTALEAALTAPDRVQSLVLLAPGVPGYPWPEEAELHAEFARLVAADDIDGLVSAALREWAAAGHEPEIVDMMRTAVTAWKYEGTLLQDPESVFDRLAHVRAPSALMVGDLDRPPVIACAKSAAERLPNCELIEMSGVDHLPSIRQPDWVADVVLRYAVG